LSQEPIAAGTGTVIYKNGTPFLLPLSVVTLLLSKYGLVFFFRIQGPTGPVPIALRKEQVQFTVQTYRNFPSSTPKHLLHFSANIKKLHKQQHRSMFASAFIDSFTSYHHTSIFSKKGVPQLYSKLSSVSERNTTLQSFATNSLNDVSGK
jgi:hypothetical protein